ncbi:MAG: patatin-like phospholipase family protein, partial [Burkholderiales bacterium]|nr:patatin-like phospholipase family protein [Burkholderiales bacterium]
LLSPLSKAGEEFLYNNIEIITLERNEQLFIEKSTLEFIYILIDGEISLIELKANEPLKIINNIGYVIGKSYINPSKSYSAIANKPSQLVKFSYKVYQQYHIRYCNMDLLINQMKLFPLYANLTIEECKELVAKVEHIRLIKNDVLFSQGDLSDSMYIVINGKLAANLNSDANTQKLIGVIGPGEPIGELGTISNQPRALSIIALTDCYLLKLHKELLEKLLLEHPNIMLEMMRSVIKRSQITLSMLKEPANIKTIVLAPAEDSQIYYKFFIKLREYLSNDVPIFEINNNNDVAAFELVIQQNWKINKVVIVYIANLNLNILKKLGSYISKFFLIKASLEEMQFQQPIVDSLYMLSVLKVRMELIVYHQTKLIANTKQYLEQYEFDLHHHIFADSEADYQRLVRFMFDRAYGLVLGGGGAKLWSHVGVLKALLEVKIPIDAIGGTSAGSVVAACYAMDHSYEAVYENVRCLMNILLPVFRLKNLTLPIISILTGASANIGGEQLFGNRLIEDLHLPFFCLSCNLNREQEVVHRIGSLGMSVRTSCSLPGIVPPVIYKGHMHVDGGLLNNLPVDIMAKVIGSKQKIIAASLSDAFISDANLYSFPMVLNLFESLLYKLGLKGKSYKFPPYFETLIKSMQVGASVKERINGHNATVLISPDLDGFAHLSIKTHDVEVMINRGYTATIEQLDKMSL